MTFLQARSATYGIFYNYWEPLGFPMLWPDVPGEVPTSEVVWSRGSFEHVHSEQASLASFNGQRKWRRYGVAIFQLFAPIGDGHKTLYGLAQDIVNLYQNGAVGSLWFRNTRITEVKDAKNAAFAQINVITEFEYDDVS